MKLTLKEKWFLFWGRGYVVNLRSKEIHQLSKKHRNCNTDKIARKMFLSKSEAQKLLNAGYNGCRWCWKDRDKG